MFIQCCLHSEQYLAFVSPPQNPNNCINSAEDSTSQHTGIQQGHKMFPLNEYKRRAHFTLMYSNFILIELSCCPRFSLNRISLNYGITLVCTLTCTVPCSFIMNCNFMFSSFFHTNPDSNVPLALSFFLFPFFGLEGFFPLAFLKITEK